MFQGTNRVGVAATLTGATAGNETFFVADVTAIGTPLFGADLAVTKTAPRPAASAQPPRSASTSLQPTKTSEMWHMTMPPT